MPDYELLNTQRMERLLMLSKRGYTFVADPYSGSREPYQVSVSFWSGIMPEQATSLGAYTGPSLYKSLDSAMDAAEEHWKSVYRVKTLEDMIRDFEGPDGH